MADLIVAVLKKQAKDLMTALAHRQMVCRLREMNKGAIARRHLVTGHRDQMEDPVGRRQMVGRLMVIRLTGHRHYNIILLMGCAFHL